MIFVSVSVYALAKSLGPAGAVAEFQRQCSPETPAIAEHLPASRVVRRLRQLDDLALRVDGGATVIGKARSRAFHEALATEADVWVSVDDDVDATSQTLEWLLDAVEGPTPRACIGPTLLRVVPDKPPVLGVEVPSIVVPRKLSRDGSVRNCTSGGFGLVALNWPALTEIAEHMRNHCPALWFRDDDGVEKLAPFADEITAGRWYGEDLSFWRRLPKSVNLSCLTTGHISHAGEVVNLQELLR